MFEGMQVFFASLVTSNFDQIKHLFRSPPLVNCEGADSLRRRRRRRNQKSEDLMRGGSLGSGRGQRHCKRGAGGN